MFRDKKCVVVGGCGFIGSHIVDRLVEEGADVIVVDNLSCCDPTNMNHAAQYLSADIRNMDGLLQAFEGADIVFHTAAIARTVWCIKDPILCYEVNVMGTLHVLEAARQCGVKRVVLSSSNIVYAFVTPYRTSKEALERLGDTYVKMYDQSVICLRYSNVYGKRQIETGESPNVFASLRKGKRETGYLLITGDGTQSRDYTHVSDIVEGNLKAALSSHCGTVDLCTGRNITLNEVAVLLGGEIKYTSPRNGDIHDIYQDPTPAKEILGWEAKVKLEEGIIDVIS